MSQKLSRNKIFELLETNTTNSRWSWCALSKDHTRGVFTLWEDEEQSGSWSLYTNASDYNNRPGAKDQKKNLEICLSSGTEVYGLICVAKDPNQSPRSIKDVKVEYLIKLKLIKDDKGILAKETGRELLLSVISKIKSSPNGLDDLLVPQGNQSPDRAKTMSYYVKRDPKVRSYVLERAQGKCEYCGEEGFAMLDGTAYLEAHHIILLAEQGTDTTENVIALCPNHHREAHFGANAETLERQFKQIVLAKH